MVRLRIRHGLLLSVLFLAAAGLSAQGVQIGEPVTPLSVDVDVRQLPIVPDWQPGDAIREAHRRLYFPPGSPDSQAPADWVTAPDHLAERQREFDQRHAPGDAAARSSRVTIDNAFTGVNPGDPVVEVGTAHVLYGINAAGGTSFRIYNKSGTLLAGPSSFRSLAPAGDPCATSVSDPIILFDRIANRWVLLEIGGTSSAYRLCTYVSKTSDPVTGGWWFYGFAAPTLPDYPHCGVWDNAYVCTTNETGSGAKIYAFDRVNMLTGATARPLQRFTSVASLAGYGFQALTPATFLGTTAAPAGAAPILARHNDDEAHAGAGANSSADFIDLYQLNINWTTPASSSVTTLPRIQMTEFNSWLRGYSTFASVPQPSSASRLDPIREVILNLLTYRNMGTHESIVGNFVTNQDAARSGIVVDAGIRWFELRRVGAANWFLQQEGTFSPGDSATHHFLGATATDKMGNIGMSYNITKVSNPVLFASLRYTGRLASDPAGVMSLGENLIAAGAAAETSGRWGDYHQTVIDPVDDCTFWTVGMYRPTGSWATRISDFRFNNCITIIAVAPLITYAPAPSTINYSSVGTASGIIAAPSGGSGSGAAATTTVGACTISNGGAAFPTTSIAQLSFVGTSSTALTLALPNCTRQAAAVNATLTCPESRGGAAAVNRIWSLNCPALPINRTLNVSRIGAGSGTVTSNPAGINCGATCSASFTDGSAVTLNAAVTVGSTFAGWGGDCAASGTNLQCALTMNQARVATASFNVQASAVINSFNASPSAPPVSSAITLNWSSNNSISCSPSLGAGTTWPNLGTLPTSGTQVLNAPANAGSLTFQLNCTNGVQAVNASSSVNVLGSPRPDFIAADGFEGSN